MKTSLFQGLKKSSWHKTNKKFKRKQSATQALPTEVMPQDPKRSRYVNRCSSVFGADPVRGLDLGTSVPPKGDQHLC